MQGYVEVSESEMIEALRRIFLRIGVPANALEYESSVEILAKCVRIVRAWETSQQYVNVGETPVSSKWLMEMVKVSIVASSASQTFMSIDDAGKMAALAASDDLDEDDLELMSVFL